MVDRQFGTMPLPEKMLAYRLLDEFQWYLNQNTSVFIQEHEFKNVCKV